jgi:ABC-type multidrug transport system fused ATPase/permease subunit
VALVLVLNFCRAIGWFKYSARISVNMHDKMFSSLLRSPAKFFSDTAPGRVMNRFTKDLCQMDELLPPMFFETSIILLQMVGVFGIVIVSNWYIAIPAFIIIIVLWFVRKFYVSTALDVKRIEGIFKSPVFTHASATFQGLTTIRSANAEKILIEQFDGINVSLIHLLDFTKYFSILTFIGCAHLCLVSFYLYFKMVRNLGRNGNSCVPGFGYFLFPHLPKLYNFLRFR